MLLVSLSARAEAPLLEPRVRTAMSAAEPKTSLADTLAAAGRPDQTWTTTVGGIDLFIWKPSYDELGDKIRRPASGKIKVKVAHWVSKEGEIQVTHVFRDDRLWYAIVPISGSEENPNDLQKRYGESARQIDLSGVSQVAKLYAYPDRGLGYVHAGGRSFAFKVIFPAGTRANELLNADGGSSEAAIAKKSKTIKTVPAAPAGTGRPIIPRR